MIDSAVINDRKNTKDDKLPEDVLKLMEYVPVDEKGDTMEDLGDHMEVLQTEGDTTKQVDDTLEDLVEYADDEGQEAETKITVKLTLLWEKISKSSMFLVTRMIWWNMLTWVRLVLTNLLRMEFMFVFMTLLRGTMVILQGVDSLCCNQ